MRADFLRGRPEDARLPNLPSGSEVIVEVKQLDPNDEDMGYHREMAAKRMAAWGKTPGDRVRQEVTDAMPQLRRFAKGRCPAVLVLYNNTGRFLLIEPYDILVALHGFQTVVLGVPPDPSERPYSLGHKFGGKPSGDPRSEHNPQRGSLDGGDARRRFTRQRLS